MALKITCGFGRVGVRDSKVLGRSEEDRQANKLSHVNLEHRYKVFQNIFEVGNQTALSFQDFSDSVTHVGKVLNNWTRNRRDEKVKFLEHFSLTNWKKLSKAAKAKHSLVGPCKACLLEHSTNWHLYNKQIKCTRTRNALCAERTFAEAEAEAHQEEITKNNKRAEKRKIAQDVKRRIEEVQKVKNKDVAVTYGSTDSLNARRIRRLAEEFETREEAEERTQKRKLLEEQGRRKPKKRLGNFEAWAEFDKERLKQEVESYEDGAKINWTQLALKYDIKQQDGKHVANVGQLLKLWLEKEQIDIQRFHSQPASVRRARMKLGGGTDITVPKKRTEKQISEQLRIMIRDGEVPIGEFVVPKKYKKYFLNRETNKIQTKIVTVEGRKQPLLHIRQNLMMSQQPFMRDPTDYDNMTEDDLRKRMEDLGEYKEEESMEAMKHRLRSIQTRRHLMYWEDGATLANHGYIVYLVATLYDEAIYLTDPEYHKKFNIRQSVQSKVEQPQLYIIARSKSSDAEQLLYVQTRRDDLPSLSIPIAAPDGREYIDILRFFKGDNPSRQFAWGNQRGGHYPCLCDVDIRGVDSYWAGCHVCNPALSIQDRQDFILEGPVTAVKASSSVPDPFSKLSKEEMKDELTYRGAVPYEQVEKMTKKELEQETKTMLRGIKRMPALLQPQPTQSLQELNIQHLEAPAGESMHDILNHTKNVLEELVHHVPKEVADKINTVKETILGDKDTVRASDMRYCLLVLVQELRQQGIASPVVMELLSTLAEVQGLSYAPASERNMRNVYRMSNVAFKHHILLRECFPGPLKTMTKRRMWGGYIHSLRDHTPVVYRVAPISSLLAENEERQFSSFKRITKTTANYARPDHITSNLFVRFFFHQSQESNRHQENKISEVAKLLPRERTRISAALMIKYKRDAQTHCERVPDFLRRGYGTHWHMEEGDVVFHDSPSEDPPSHPAGPALHHFRSMSIKGEHEYLKQEWEKCLQEGVAMPICKVWIYNGQNLANRVSTPFLDEGFEFTVQRFSYLKEKTQDEEDTEEDEYMEKEDEVTQDDLDKGEDGEDEEIIRMDRLDPEPELEDFEDDITSTLETGVQVADNQTVMSPRIPLKVLQPGQSPSRIRMETREETACSTSTPTGTPPKTPVQEAAFTRNSARNGDGHRSSVTTPSSAGRENLRGTVTMTPPATPSFCPKDKSRDGLKYKTKLGTALAVVLGDVPIVEQVDRRKAALKAEPHNKFFKKEYDSSVAQVSGQLSKHLHEDRKAFEVWERSFVVEKGRLPSAVDVKHSDVASVQERKIRYAEHLLRSFGVNFQMT
ncbi:LGMN [Branchiostoma lanceolatum]|uniref:LGMN protein n=1 Tax=Branchiostoma lanceolatum TaxID=7740 RepID=A0A8J9ZBD5_BRALA|nr:LGMN [Branchiostoma lanceolatum]